MSEPTPLALPANETSTRDLDFAQARLAYSIIEALLEHTQIISDLIALMAQVLDEDTTKALTNTPQWKAYLESRRSMEGTRINVEKFAEIMQRLADGETF
jgi:non-ribosomal peptide synthetase component F